MKRAHIIALLVCGFFFTHTVFAAPDASLKEQTSFVREADFSSTAERFPPYGLRIFKRAYPDLIFTEEYDTSVEDWRIDITFPRTPGTPDPDGITETFYWAGGSLLPKEELSNKDKYWTLLYHYDKVLSDPADFSQEQIDSIKRFSGTDNRQNGAGTPMFFFDALYDSTTKARLESHLRRITFLGKSVTVHERLVAPLQNVEARITSLSRTDAQVDAFVKEISSLGAYYWRIIAGTNRKSFHSLGIAVDIQPKRLNGRAIYWSWTRDKDPENWMLTPLSKRWMPPQSVISLFEEEGFIWGGKWVIFDNMHFEYHPELIYYNVRHPAP